MIFPRIFIMHADKGYHAFGVYTNISKVFDKLNYTPCVPNVLPLLVSNLSDKKSFASLLKHI